MLITTVGEVVRLDLEEMVARAQPAFDTFVVKGTTGRDGGFWILLDLMAEQGLKFYRSEREENLRP